jgi:putative ABC transport system substrate-binding protein
MSLPRRACNAPIDRGIRPADEPAWQALDRSLPRRRWLAIAAAGTLAASRAWPTAVPRIGLLSFGSAPSGPSPDPWTGLRDGLRSLGYEAGRNLMLEFRYADGRPERLRADAAELVASKVDLIMAGGPAPLHAARRATSTIPIVAVAGSDPVAEGWARGLDRPGGNVTGLTVTFPELGPKRLEILAQAVPGLARIAALYAPADHVNLGPESAGAHALGLQLQRLEVGVAEDLPAAFERAVRNRAQALYAVSTNTIVTSRTRIAELAVAHGLPSIGDFPLLAQAGLLMSYGADLDALGRRAATYIDKILKGARPGELPIERPTDFELVINRGTARALGRTLPEALLLRADRVIG